MSNLLQSYGAICPIFKYKIEKQITSDCFKAAQIAISNKCTNMINAFEKKDGNKHVINKNDVKKKVVKDSKWIWKTIKNFWL